MSGRGREGFALAMVVLLLFFVGVAAATTYQVVRLEAEMAIGSEEASDAYSVAQAGLERYLAESLGYPDTAMYTVGSGSATVTPRRLARMNDSTWLYVIRSEGQVSDARYPATPARRTVAQYAHLHTRPISITATVLTTDTVSIVAAAQVDGDDWSGGTCSGGNITGVAYPPLPKPFTGSGGNLHGHPDHNTLGSVAAVVNAARVNWDILQNPQQPVGEWDGVWPSSFSTLGTDSFPVIRVPGNFDGQYTSGRGLLIVPGTFDIGSAGDFFWEGIILAGALDASVGGSSVSQIKGLLVAGLDGGSPKAVNLVNTQYLFHRCNAWYAAANAAYLEPVDESWWGETR